MNLGPCSIGCLLLLSLPLVASGEEAPIVEISAASRDEQGFLLHSVTSPYQAGPTQIRVLLPSDWKAETHYPVIYLLPVEPGSETRYGDGLLEVQTQDLHNKHQAIFVAPTFSQLPWFADHPTDPTIRQESHLLQAVLPFIERTYPVSPRRQDRLLLGFSKSGWGAWSLLLRHPEIFGKAAAWDAPLMMNEIGQYGNRDIFATQTNFVQYRITDLLKASADQLQAEPRLILTGYGNFRTHHQQAHQLLNQLKISHDYRDGPARKHDWRNGWVAEAVDLLLKRE